MPRGRFLCLLKEHGSLWSHLGLELTHRETDENITASNTVFHNMPNCQLSALYLPTCLCYRILFWINKKKLIFSCSPPCTAQVEVALIKRALQLYSVHPNLSIRDGCQSRNSTHLTFTLKLPPKDSMLSSTT